MRAAIAVAVLVLAASSAHAGGGSTHSLNGRGAYIDRHTGAAVSVPTRLQPVVGSVQRGHLTNPLTGTTNYRSTVYNPTLGSFGKYKFRR